MTADLASFTPSPERAFEIAHEGGVRLSFDAKVNALIFAAQQTEADLRFVGDREHWVTIRRLMRADRRADAFGSLVAAVAAGFGPQIRAQAERLVTP